jgi:hypothetical protein
LIGLFEAAAAVQNFNLFVFVVAQVVVETIVL